ncbi:hypothetical protein [Demequina sp.]|uniref:hypothetical protein n=1 Tax=Demequina sp. TaxID=2050685 RepID=UPI003D11BAAB
MSRDWRSDDGSAVVEFVFLSIVLMIPIVYLVLCLGAVQSAAFAAEAVARDASRAAVVGGVDALREGASYSRAEETGRERASAVAQTTLEDFHLVSDDVDMDLRCTGSPCLEPGSDVEVSVTVHVSLPGLGALLPGAVVSVDSQGTSPVDGYLP